MSDEPKVPDAEAAADTPAATKTAAKKADAKKAEAKKADAKKAEAKKADAKKAEAKKADAKKTAAKKVEAKKAEAKKATAKKTDAPAVAAMAENTPVADTAPATPPSAMPEPGQEAPAAPLDSLAQLGERMAVADDSAADSGAMAGDDVPQMPPRPKRDAQGRAYATGKRKTSVARVWIRPGRGQIVVNGKDLDQYFARPTLQMMIRQPFGQADRADQFDVMCTVRGGGLSGQAGAVRHGVSRALVNFEPELRPTLKSSGFLTRDAREVERKKYGRPKARRSFQFSKR